MKKYIIGIVLALALPSLVLAFNAATLTNGYNRVAVYTKAQADKLFSINYVLETKKPECRDCVGANSGPEFYNQAHFYESFVKGGKLLDASTTLTIARTITAAELCRSKTITVNSAAVAGTNAAASLDLTFAATSTLFADCLRNEGDEISLDIVNQSPTAASTTELVAGVGCQVVIGIADGDATIPGQKGATVEIKRMKDWLANGGTKDCVIKVYEWN